jgi:hypothetical protein
VAVGYLRAALRVIADEVKRRAFGSGGVVRSLGAMAEKRFQESRRLLARRPGGGRTSHAGVWKSAFDSGYGVVVQLEISVEMALFFGQR